MDRFFEYVKTHRAYSALLGCTVIIAIIFIGTLLYGNDLPDEKSQTSSTSSSSSSSSSSQTSSSSTPPSVTSPAETTSTTQAKSSSTTSSTSARSGSSGSSGSSSSVKVKSITVTGASGGPNDDNSSWQFPISADVTMNRGGHVPLTFTFNLSTGESQVVQSSNGTASITWALPHCQDGSFTVTVSGAGPARTSNKGYATWSNC